MLAEPRAGCVSQRGALASLGFRLQMPFITCAGTARELGSAREMFLLFIFTNDHIIYLEYAKHQQVLTQAASKGSQQTV